MICYYRGEELYQSMLPGFALFKNGFPKIHFFIFKNPKMKIKTEKRPPKNKKT